MKLREYASKINKLLKKHGDLDVIYSCDDEGNQFDYVQFAPSAGIFLEGGFVGNDEDPECICVN